MLSLKLTVIGKGKGAVMVFDGRRERILKILSSATGPVKGNELADTLGVTRQVIVQDIAILRAAGEEVIATPRGYMLIDQMQPKTIIRTIACRHQTRSEIEQELTAIVDLGGTIIDVIIEHPIYGEKKGVLMIASRQDVKDFMASVKNEHAQPLSTLTGGIHLHTIQVKDEESYMRIKNRLKEMGFLIEE